MVASVRNGSCWLALLLACIHTPKLLAQTALEFTLNGQAQSLPLTTPVLIDGVAATLADLQQLPNGLQLRWTGNAAAGRGVVNLVFSYSLIGPVTGNAPLEVLGQPVTVTGDTVLAAVPPDASLPLNTPVVVAGLVDANGSVQATLVERRGQFGNTFLLTGAVQAIDPVNSLVQVGAQWISYQGQAISGCAAALPVPGEFLSVRTQAVPNYQPGTVLDQVISALCVTPVPPGVPGATGFLQGVVSAVVDPGRFVIGSLDVLVTPATQFVFGAVDDLAAGTSVVIDGSYQSATIFDAAVVEFVRPVVRFQAPVTPAQVDPGESISPYDLLVRNSAQVRDEDGILANGLAQTRQVEVRGYLDRLGRAYATRVRDRGNPNINSVRLRGPVETIADPLISIQGLNIDTAGVTFLDEFGAPMTSVQFFAQVQASHIVDISGASFAANTRTLSGGTVVYIGAEPVILPPPAATAAAAINSGTVSGYSLQTPLFVDGFEG
jgi:hypothetical protein